MRPSATLPPPKTVLVFRFSAAGDVILTAPALSALRAAWPASRIVFVTHAPLVPLVASHPAVHAVVGLAAGEPLWQLRRRLAAWQPEAILDLHGKARGALLRWSWPRARHARWHKRPLAQTLAVRLGGARYHATALVTERYHAAVEALVGRRLPPQPLRYHLAPAALNEARATLGAHGVAAQRPLVGMSPGAAWASKRWPLARFVALARWTLAQGAAVILTGGANERAANQGVARQVSGVIDLTGQLTLAQLPGVVALCSAYVANDSGPMHLARALQVPTLAVFGSTDPGQFDFSGHALLFAAAPCSPCSFHGLAACPRGHLACLEGIPAAAAAVQLEALLRQGPRPAVRG